MRTAAALQPAVTPHTTGLLHELPSLARGWEALPTGVKALVLDEAMEIDDDPIVRLSREAIHYAASLPFVDPRSLSSRLYRYNTVPSSPCLQAALGSTAQVAGILGLTGSSPMLRSLRDAGYQRLENVQWHAWTRGHFDPECMTILRHKLYVSPAPNAIADVVDRTLRVAVRMGVPSFKIGRSAGNLLRPDKFLLFLDSAEEVDRVVTELSRELAGFPAQGVPFTRALDSTGMLSVGADPPRSLCASGWAQAECWRAWIADRLALALLQARSFSKDTKLHTEFALTKVAIEGIDTRTWTPTAQLWKGEAA